MMLFPDHIQVYQVGGSVRDQLLGLTPKDRDHMVVGAAPNEMKDLGFEQVGADFPVFLHPETKEEYALARTEAKHGTGYKGFVCDFGPDITLEEDLKRRDLTINAMALSADGRLIDPYGGRADLEARVLRHVSPAFAEDPLRVLRAAQFAARFADLGFTVAKETLELMRDIAKSGELASLTPERVWMELAKALTSKRPSVFLSTLRAAEALSAVLPEIDVLYGVPQPEEHHPEIDTGRHIELVLDQARQQTDTLGILYAALVHDLGKGITPKEDWPKHRGHEQTGRPLVAALSDRLKVPASIKRLGELVCEHHLRAHRALEMRPAKIIGLFEMLDVFRRPETLEHFLIACEADARGRTGLEGRPYPQADYLRAAFGAAQAIKAQPFLERGIQGADLKAHIHAARVEAVKAVKASASSD